MLTTTLPKEKTTAADSSNNDALMGVSIALAGTVLTLFIVVAVFVIHHCNKKNSQPESIPGPEEYKFTFTSDVENQNTNGEPSLSDIPVENAPPEPLESVPNPSIDSQYSTGSSDLEQDGSHDKSEPSSQRSSIIPQNPENNIIKEYAISDTKELSEYEALSDSTPVQPVQPTEETGSSEGAMDVSHPSHEVSYSKQVADLMDNIND